LLQILLTLGLTFTASGPHGARRYRTPTMFVSDVDLRSFKVHL
jgi:hypothetical protein